MHIRQLSEQAEKQISSAIFPPAASRIAQRAAEAERT